jgi:PAS domain S-box-containing protein
MRRLRLADIASDQQKLHTAIRELLDRLAACDSRFVVPAHLPLAECLQQIEEPLLRGIRDATNTEKRLYDMQALVDRSPAVIFLWRVADDWPVEYVSDSITQFGYTPEELRAGRITWVGMTHPDDVPWLEAEVADYTRRGIGDFHQQYRILTKTGDVRWVDDHTIAILDADGTLTHYQGIILDITERRQAEAAIRASEERFRAMIEHSAEAMALLRADGTFLYASPAASRINGFSPDVFLGQNAFEIMHPDDLDAAYAAFTRLRNEPDTLVTLQCRVRHADGTWRWVEAVGSNQLTEPAIQALVVNYHDITAQKDTEAALHEAYAEMEQRVQTRTAELTAANAALRHAEAIAHLGHWEWDVATHAARWSDETFRIFGIPPQPMTLESFLALVHPEDRGLLAVASTELHKVTAISEVDYRIVRPDGAVRVLHGVGEVEYDETDAPLRVFGTILDITAQKDAEATIRSLARFPEESPGPVLRVDAEGLVLYRNPAAAVCDCFGVAVGQPLPAPLWMAARQALETGASIEVEVPCDARTFLVTCSAAPADGCVNLYGSDITERKEAEVGLRTHEALLKVFIDHVPSAVAMFDTDMRYLAVSSRWRADYHLKGREIIGISHYTVFPEIGERWKAIHQRCLAGTTERCEEDPFPRADGTVDWVRWEIVPWHKTDGSIGGIIMFTEVITARKQAEAALRESEAKYRQLYESMRDAFARVDLEGHIVESNAQYQEMVGYTAEELAQLTYEEITPERWHTMEARIVTEQVLAQGYSSVYEKEYIRKDGTIFPVELRSILLRDAAGTPTGMWAFMRDITERKQAVEALRESEARYRQLFNDSPISLLEEDFAAVKQELDALRLGGVEDMRAYFLAHPDEVTQLASQVCIRSVNRATLLLYRADSAELLLRNLTQIFNGNALEVFREELIAFAAGETRFESEATQRTLDGERRDVTIRCNVAPGYERTLGKIIVAITDITERKRTEARLEQVLAEMERWAAELDTTISSIADGVIIYGPGLEIYRMNAMARQILGYTSEQGDESFDARLASLQVRTVDGAILTPDDNPPARALRGETVHNVMLSLTHADATVVWVSLSAAPIYGADGVLFGVVVTMADITTQREQQQHQEEFLHLVSHDLRIPLTVIQGHAQVLDGEIGATPALHVSTQAILRGTQRMNVMIQDLVDMARIEGRQLSLRREAVPLQYYLPDLLQRLAGTLAVERVTLDVPPSLPPVRADYDRLERIMVNLLSNALKYSAAESPVHVCATHADDMVVLTVTDQGIGIPAEALPHLFERFYRVPSDRKAEGLGLGLYITRLLVEAHGGQISVESVYGHGSTFRVSLPRAANEQC